MGRFKKGLFFGGMLGAGLTWLMTTTKGKNVRGQMLDHAADAYTKLREEVLASESYDKLTKSRYVKKVEKYVKAYAKEHNLSTDVAQVVTKLVSSQWKAMRDELKK